MKKLLGTILVAVNLFAGVAQADDGNRFELYNNSDEAIMEVYIRAPGKGWSKDLLGSGYLKNTDSMFINPRDKHDGECSFDLRLVTEDGSQYTLRDKYVCGFHDLEVTEFLRDHFLYITY